MCVQQYINICIVIRPLLLWRLQSINLLILRGEIRQPFDAKMRQIFQTNKSVVFQLPCEQVICGSLQADHLYRREMKVFKAVLRIRIHASDKWIRVLLFSSLTFKMPTENLSKKKFFCFEGTFTSFFIDKKSKRSQKTVGMKVFLTIFA